MAAAPPSRPHPEGDPSRPRLRDMLDGSRPRPVPLLQLATAALGAPVIWALHLPAVYFLVAVGCATRWGGTDAAILVVTAVLAAASAASGWLALHWWRRLGGDGAEPGVPEVHRFLIVVGLAAAPLFTGAVVLQGLSPLFVPTC